MEFCGSAYASELALLSWCCRPRWATAPLPVRNCILRLRVENLTHALSRRHLPESEDEVVPHECTSFHRPNAQDRSTRTHQADICGIHKEDVQKLLHDMQCTGLPTYQALKG